MSNNLFAEYLKNQGCNVILIDGIYWFEYQSFMMPAYLLHCLPEISRENAKKALAASRRPFVRWDVHWGTKQTTEWWYILKRGNWDIEQVTDKKKRWMIKQGRKNYDVRPMSFSEVIELCPSVAKFAMTRYGSKAEVETKEIFCRKISAAEKVPGVLEYIGCFQKDRLVGYAENLIQENGLWIHVIRHDPAYLKEYSGYGLIDGLLSYYLNERKMGCVYDGCRCIHHKTQFQEHLVKIFGFTREYSVLEVEYARAFSMGVKILYPLRKWLWFLAEKSENSLIQNIAAVLRQESIRISCGKVSFFAEEEASKTTSV
jgi:hypothetical protein